MNLKDYDWIVVNTSGGKDSQTQLRRIVALADKQGVSRKRLVAVHADLGRVEWKGTRALAEDQVKYYGLRFIVVSRPQGDLLTHVEQRGKWPSSTARYCTSDHKRGQVDKVLTALVAEHRAATGSTRRVRILNCLGFRAQESRARAARSPVSFDKRASNGKRHVDTWYPIFDWTEAQVWADIKASGVPSHGAYDTGVPRLSCVFCIFAPTSALEIAGRHNPELLDQYVEVEQRIRHTFKSGLSLASVRQAIRSGTAAVQVSETDADKWCL